MSEQTCHVVISEIVPCPFGDGFFTPEKLKEQEAIKSLEDKAIFDALNTFTEIPKSLTYQPINHCLWFSEGEMAGQLLDFMVNRNKYMWWYYRDVILQAQHRCYLRIVGHSEEDPFYDRKFEEAIVLEEKMKQLIDRARNNPK